MGRVALPAAAALAIAFDHESEDHRVRVAAASAIFQLGGATVLPFLSVFAKALLADRDAAVRIMIADAFSQLDVEGNSPFAVTCAASCAEAVACDTCVGVRIHAARALGKMGETGRSHSARLIETFVAESEAQVRGAALAAICELDVQHALIPTLMESFRALMLNGDSGPSLVCAAYWMGVLWALAVVSLAEVLSNISLHQQNRWRVSLPQTGMHTCVK